MSPKLRKNEFFAQKIVTFFLNFIFCRNPISSKKNCPIAETNPIHLHNKFLRYKPQYYSVGTTNPCAAGRTKCGTAS